MKYMLCDLGAESQPDGRISMKKKLLFSMEHLHG
jgi:hypothetical protein